MKYFILIPVFLFSAINIFAQNNFVSSFNAKKSSIANNDTEYEYEIVDNGIKQANNNDTEYEYEDGTVKDKIKSTNKSKRKGDKLVKKYVGITQQEKLTYGYNAPSEFFDLSDWSLSVPEDRDGNHRADNIKERELSSGYLSDYFYATNKGAMVFTCPIGGFRTSGNTSYTRVELREMLRAGNTSIKAKGPTKNNWVLKSSKSAKHAGGYNGNLKATLAVNHVTTTGYSSQIGRVIIGQIHARDDEPIRLYYRKLPNNKKGSIYFAHEAKDREDYYELIGSKSSSAKNLSDGIELNEKFSYEISLINNELSVKIFRPFKPVVEKVINIRKSGYKDRNEYLYFKAGVYNQNKTGDPEDYVQATFYELSNSHHKNF